MTWKPGQSGNPGGKTAERPFLDALQRAIAQDSSDRLRKCAETLLDEAAKGTAWAVQMLADRLDGKAAQEITVKREVRDLSMEEILAELAKSRVADRVAPAKKGAKQPGIVH